MPPGSAQFSGRPVERVYPRHVPTTKVFLIMPAIYWTVATLTIENTSLTLTSGVGLDEYTQSGHGSSPTLKLLNATCSDAVIGMGTPASLEVNDC